jgi:hypothetical protein
MKRPIGRLTLPSQKSVRRKIAMTRLLTLVAALGLVSTFTLTAQATPRTRTEYVVAEVHPATKGAVSTTRYRNRADAVRHYDSLKKAHWVQWKFLGINEPMRYRRFTSAAQAQAFINNDGPSKSGKLGIALLTNDTKILKSRVSFSQVEVPVSGGGNGGGGNAGEVIDVIEGIIGIIDR